MDRIVTTTYHGATRRTNSVNGNPRFTLHTGEGDFMTGNDASVGYDIENHSGRPEHSPSSWVGQTVRLTVTRRGMRVTNWEKA
jgi:hypothetical protein